MPLFVNEDKTVNLGAIVSFVVGLAVVRGAVVSRDYMRIGLGVALALGAVGIGMRNRWGWLGMLAANLLLIYLCIRSMVRTSVGVINPLLVLAALWGVWACVRNFFRAAAPTKPKEEKDSPIISLVFLLSRPRYLETCVLIPVVESAWGGNYSHEDEAKRDGFVVGEGCTYVIKSPMGLFGVNNFACNYWGDDAGKVAEKVPNLRLRKIVTEHQAWLSVDFFSSAFVKDGAESEAALYAVIIRLINELADDTVLGIYRPETGAISEWSDQVQDALLRPKGEERFHRAGNVPVVPVPTGDAELAAAVAEAKRRWPEFVAAYQQRQKDDMFTIKAPITVNDNTEHIWVSVDGLEPDFVHGTLGNDPVDLGDLRLGSRVEVAVAAVEDWGFKQGDADIVGLFSAAVVWQRQQRRPAD